MKVSFFYTLSLTVCLALLLPERSSGWDMKKNGFRDYPMGVLDGTARVEIGKPDFVVTTLNRAGIGAAGGLKVGDHIIAAGGVRFPEYDNDMLSGGKGGPKGLGDALNEALEYGKLELTVLRGGQEVKLSISVPRWGRLSDKWPLDDSRRVQDFRKAVCKYINEELVEKIGESRSTPAANFVSSAMGLALLASGEPKYKSTLKTLADSLVEQGDFHSNWECFFTGIFLSEYYLATKDTSVKDRIQKDVTLLESRMNEKGYIGHGGAYPEGMYGHEAGFNPIQSGSLWFMALAQKCGAKVNRTLWEANVASLERSSGKDGAVGYSNWAHGGKDAHDRSSKTLLGLCVARKHSKFRNNIAMYLENNPGSMRESHAVCAVGVMDTLMALYIYDRNLYHKILNQWKWYFTLAEGPDQVGLYIGGKRNNGGDHYLKEPYIMNAMLGIVLSAPKQSLYIYGGIPNIPGISPGALSPRLLRIIKSFNTQKPAKTLAQLRKIINEHPRGKEAAAAVLIGRYIFNEQVKPYWQEVLDLYTTGKLYETKVQYDKFVNDCGHPKPIAQEMRFLESMLSNPRGRKVINRGKIYNQLLINWTERPWARQVIARKFSVLAKDTSDIYGKKAAHAVAMLQEQTRKKEEQSNISEADIEASRRAALE